MPLASLRSRVQPLIQTATFAGLRWGFRVGERVAPDVAARYAQALWMKVPAAKPAAGRDRGLPPGEPLDVRVGESRLEAYLWGEGPVVLAVHGWSGWWQQLSVHIERLVDDGFRVVAWDAPSHGSSGPGRFGEGRSGMPDLQDAIHAVTSVAAPDGVHGIVAHSGGAMAAALAVADGLPVQRVALVAPSVDIPGVLEMLGGRVGWGPRTIESMLRRTEEQFGLDVADFDVVARLAAATRPLPDALVVADTADRDTPEEGARALAAAWPGSRFLLTEGLGHYKVLWSPAVVDEVARFMAGGPSAGATF